MNIFVVDDEKAVRDYIVSLPGWERLGCKIIGQAADGLEAYEALSEMRERIPDILISDIRMPVMDGIELSRRILEKFPDIKVIFLTAYSEFNYAKQAVKLGVSDFITKPFHESELLDSVKWIKEHRVDRQNAELIQQEEWIQTLLNSDLSEQSKSEALDQPELFMKSAVFLSIEIDNVDFLDYTGKPFSKLTLREKIFEVMSFCPFPYWSTLSQSGVYLILFIPFSLPNEETAHEAMDVARRILETSNESLGFSVSIGISDRLDSVLELGRGLEEAKSCLDYRMLIGRKSIIAYQAVRSLQEQKRVQMEINYTELIEVLRKGEAALIPDYLKNMNRVFLLEGLNKKRILEECMEMVTVTGKTLVAFGLQPSPEETLAVRKSVLSFTILSDLMQFMEQFLERAVAVIKSVKQKSSVNLIDHVTKFIESRYMEDITLQMLAEELFINYSFLSRLIKKETGQNFRDLLWSYRIEMAKIKLSTTSLKHYEVAYAVGFKDPAHFSQLFKKLTGKSPGEYKA
jgi:two-component system response regulator YesN